VSTSSQSFADLYAQLDPKEQAFVDEYLECLNATLAARRVWGAKDSKQMGYKCAHRPDVGATIKAGLEEQRDRTKNDPDRIIRELMLVAYADPVDLLDIDGNPVPLHQLPPEIRRAIASIELEKVTDHEGTKTHVVRYKLVPKTPSLELLGKRLKMFTDRLELDAADSLASLIAQAFNRPGKAS
jgi:phage terminase small subunit